MKSKTTKIIVLILFISLILAASFYLFNTYVKKAVEYRQNPELVKPHGSND
jgi:uncharacterized protein with PQ loop repeat